MLSLAGLEFPHFGIMASHNSVWFFALLTTLVDQLCTGSVFLQFNLAFTNIQQVEIFQGRGGFIESRHFEKNFLQIRALFSVFEKGQGGGHTGTHCPPLPLKYMQFQQTLVFSLNGLRSSMKLFLKNFFFWLSSYFFRIWTSQHQSPQKGTFNFNHRPTTLSPTQETSSRDTWTYLLVHAILTADLPPSPNPRNKSKRHINLAVSN